MYMRLEIAVKRGVYSEPDADEIVQIQMPDRLNSSHSRFCALKYGFSENF